MANCVKCNAELAEGAKFCPVCGANQAPEAAQPQAQPDLADKIMGILLFIVGVAGAIVGLLPIIGWILAPIISLATLALTILGIVNVCQGKAKELPIIGKYKILK